MARFIAVLLCLVLVVVACAATKTDDGFDWFDIRLDMSIEEVEKTLPNARWSPLGTGNLDNTRIWRGVELSEYYFAVTGGEHFDVIMVSAPKSAWRTLTNMLIKKYGDSATVNGCWEACSKCGECDDTEYLFFMNTRTITEAHISGEYANIVISSISVLEAEEPEYVKAVQAIIAGR